MVQEDLGGFGDERLRRVGARLLEAMSEQPTTCVHALANDRNEALAFGRFLDHDAVSHGEMLTTAARFTGQRAVGRHVLAIQDTTEFNFPSHAASKCGFGRSGNDRDLGLFLHPTIAVNAANGGMIGLVGAQILNRTGAKVKQTIYFRNKRVEPSNDYVYDALYRLIQANGREHLGQTGAVPNPPTSPDAFNAFHIRLDHPGDGNAVGTYIERYVYDAVGNFLQMQHRGSDPA